MKPAPEGLTMDQLAERNAELVKMVDALRSVGTALASELYDLKHSGNCLSPKRETPELNAFLNEVRADGAELYGNHTIQIGEEENDEDIIYAGKQALLFAAQLREGAAQ